MHKFPLLSLALRRRRTLILSCASGALFFQSIIIIIVAAIDPTQLIAAKLGSHVPSAFQAFSGSSNHVPLNSYPGILGSGLIHPIILAIQLTIIASFTGALVASDKENGILELILTHPVSRLRVFTERLFALITATFIISSAVTLPLFIGNFFLSANIPLSNFLPLLIAQFLFFLSLAVPGLIATVLASSARSVTSATVVFAVISYFLNFTSIAFPSLSSLHYLTLFYYYSPADILNSGVNYLYLLLLLVIFLVGSALSYRLFKNRDI